MQIFTILNSIKVKRSACQICRDNGNCYFKEVSIVSLKLPSGEIRKIHKECYSTVGAVGNKDYINQTIGKAGRSRWLNKRPKVRGVAMNPVDHPLGGGGKSSGGRHPVSPTSDLQRVTKPEKNISIVIIT